MQATARSNTATNVLPVFGHMLGTYGTLKPTNRAIHKGGRKCSALRPNTHIASTPVRLLNNPQVPVPLQLRPGNGRSTATHQLVSSPTALTEESKESSGNFEKFDPFRLVHEPGLRHG